MIDIRIFFHGFKKIFGRLSRKHADTMLRFNYLGNLSRTFGDEIYFCK